MNTHFRRVLSSREANSKSKNYFSSVTIVGKQGVPISLNVMCVIVCTVAMPLVLSV